MLIQRNNAIDILILSNAPGELATWVKPVVQVLRQKLGDDRDQVRISVILSPCANASGQEVAIARRFPEVDRVQGAKHFFQFLLWGKTAENWDWRQRGVVLFLGGDQFFPVVIGKRLGYRTVVYAEWEARWHAWIDRFAIMHPKVAAHVAPKHADKFTVVGDLMAEVGAEEARTTGETESSKSATDSPLIGLLPGSKPMKLALGLPLTLAIAERVAQIYPNIRFVMPVAPTLDLQTLAKYGSPLQNPIIQRFGWAEASLAESAAAESGTPILKTGSGLQVELWTPFPAYEMLSQCTLCITTVGANTAELGALAVPMIVLLPTQQMDVMRAWDGLPGLLANLPGVGSAFATVINWWALRRLGLLAWPNIWARAEIVPELVGKLQPEDVAAMVLDFLKHPEKLNQMQANLRQVRGQTGAAEKLVQLVCQEIEKGGRG
ncbi:lipid-A-disaccharide synthase [Leptothermofonsia sp. ETS-13]|uniref:lipid-A-disaccharide synthase n=1 Tax=Leptothermofonsia sp. ETS-13 TaxID=3035696 RepID=UPI003BA06A6C